MRETGLKFASDARPGYTRIVSPETAPLRLIEFGVVRLERHESLILPASKREVILTLLGGRCTVEGSGEKVEIGPRKDVFEDQPWAVYAREIDRLKLTARARLEIVVSGAPAPSREFILKVIEPRDVVERFVGSGTCRRRVRTIVGEEFEAEKLLVGETLNEAGKWSSYPPHRHEKDSPPDEFRLEEVFYYRLENPKSFGLQRIYTDDRRIDETHTVCDGDVCVFPRGYHPVAATPGSRLYYFWALAGKTRQMHTQTDPDFL